MKIVKLTAALLLFAIYSCTKEKHWNSEILELIPDSTEVEIMVNYNLKGNNNFLYVGVCVSLSENPTIADYTKELQKKSTGTSKFYLSKLDYATTYHVRGYIKKQNSSEVIYSENYSFKTKEAPVAPCETEEGKISYNGTSFSMSTLSESTIDDYYELSTSGGFGELNFKFKSKPTKNNLYTTLNSTIDFTNNNVTVSGVLGIGWLTCFYRSGNGQKVYTEVDENGAVTVKICELKMHTSGSCESTRILTGEIKKD